MSPVKISQVVGSKTIVNIIAGTVVTCRCIVVVLFCVVIWCAAEFSCHFPTLLFITFDAFINANEVLNVICVFYLNLFTSVFIIGTASFFG